MFLNAAVTEDPNMGADPLSNPKPSTKFLLLESESEEQPGKPLA
jgi:hypothetical protein